MKLVHNLYGQTTELHGLIAGFEQTQDLETIKSKLIPGAKIEVYTGQKGWVPATVIKKTSKYVLVDMPEKRHVKVHPGLCKIK
jgi:hypothetical protein